jgi:hypothetical protein
MLGKSMPSNLDEFTPAMTAFLLCSEKPPQNLPSELTAKFAQILKAPIENRLEVFQNSGLPVKMTADGNKLEIDPGRLDAARFVSESRVATRAGLRHRLLYERALMALTSQSEWLVSQLMRVFFERFPSAAGDDEKFFSLQDLEHINSITDARNALIESRVEQQMRLSLDDWIKFFRQKTRLSFDFLEPRLPVLREVFQRRNLVIRVLDE